MGYETAKSVSSSWEAQVGEGLGKLGVDVFRTPADLNSQRRSEVHRRPHTCVSQEIHDNVLGKLGSLGINKALFLEYLFY